MLKVLEKRHPAGATFPVGDVDSCRVGPVGGEEGGIWPGGAHSRWLTWTRPLPIQTVECPLAARGVVFAGGALTSSTWNGRRAWKFAVVGMGEPRWWTTAALGACQVDDHKLVVPEVNGDVVGAEDLILANPNCTTMQLVMCLKPIHDKWGIERGVVSTYQSVTGTGQAAVDQCEWRARGLGSNACERVYPHAIDQNCLPHCDVFMDNGYTQGGNEGASGDQKNPGRPVHRLVVHRGAGG